MNSEIRIREIKKNEINFLSHFLFDAIFIPEGVKKPGKEIIQIPSLHCYIKDFGKNTDIGLVAELNGEIIGAIWSRIFTETQKGYGFVNITTPELCMSVKETYRGEGIGKRLLSEIIDRLINANYKQVSLSVDKLNFAVKMYESFGFKIYNSDEESVTMIKKLSK